MDGVENMVSRASPLEFHPKLSLMGEVAAHEKASRPKLGWLQQKPRVEGVTSQGERQKRRCATVKRGSLMW